MTNSSIRYEEERQIVGRFLLTRKIAHPQLSDPNLDQANDSGVDVLWTVDERAIGFQVTEYHSDEGREPDQRGSQLRREEAQKAASGHPYTMRIGLDPTPGLAERIRAKVQKGASSRFDELVLLVACSGPHERGGVAATLLLDMALDVATLNAATHSMLAGSVYDRAYIFNMVGLQGPAVYRWTREGSWRRE